MAMRVSVRISVNWAVFSLLNGVLVFSQLVFYEFVVRECFRESKLPVMDFQCCFFSEDAGYRHLWIEMWFGLLRNFLNLL